MFNIVTFFCNVQAKHSGETFFGMYFTSDVVRHTRQLELYDLGTIVAAVGGSMGLFLGFSCLGFCQWLCWWAIGCSSSAWSGLGD